MASKSEVGRVVKYVTKAGTRYKAIVQYGGRKYIEGGFTHFSKARMRSLQMKEELIEGIYLSPRQRKAKEEAARVAEAAKNITVAEYATIWLNQWREDQQAGIVSANTLRTYKSAVKQHILPLLGAARLSGITVENIEDWYRKVCRGLSASTKANAYRTLSSMMRSAVEQRLIVENPCHIKVKKVTRQDHKRRQHYFTHSEFLEFIEQLQAGDMPSYVGIAGLVYYTACRPSEARALRCKDVDLKRKRVWFGHGMQRGENGEAIEGPTKTRRDRWAPLPQPLIEILTPLLAGLDGEAWVFSSPTDSTVVASDKHVSGRMRRALDAVGLRDAELYDLKHTCLTNLGRAGASLKELMDLPGHTQLETVLKYQLSDFERIAAAVDRMVGNLE